MERFLNNLAKELYGKYGEDISRVCIVLPSKRAGMFFKRYLAEEIKQPLWSPNVFSIDEFIQKLSPNAVSDDLTLIFELYETYKALADEEAFDKFYPWGQMLLRDFNVVDKYLVDAKRLFTILYEHREIEEDFELKLSDIEEFSKFWSTFSAKELSDAQSDFIKTWEIMGRVYHEYRKNLTAKNICYEGMAYRHVYEMAAANELSKAIQSEYGWKKVVFAGFNMLSKTEQGIIKNLVNQNLAEIYWDTDKYYLDNNIQEAGNFLRKNFRDLEINSKDILWKSNDLTDSKKNIKIIGTPLKVSQAKALGNELKNITELTETAVVLPDDTLLQPVLNSLPPNIDKLNISMGFPLKSSPLYSLLFLLKNIQSQGKSDKASSSYYHKDITRILLHPYVKFTAPEEIYAIVDHIKSRNVIYTSRKRILEGFVKPPLIVSEIFNKPATANESLEYIYRITELISHSLEQDKTSNVLETEYLFKFYTELNHLSDILGRYSAEIDKQTFWKLLLEVTASLQIPFNGEPFEGLQVMGLLETRLGDFKNVFILSMNEGVMPRGNDHGSFIPFNLRKGMGMPVFEDDDSNTAYNFYRLLQRAENITLIYNTEPGEISAGEKSRFIMQVEQELAEANKHVTIENKILQADVELPARREITIQKSDEVLAALKKKKGFSATALSAYINCPLQFYFRTVTGLKEDDEVEEFFTGGGFGNILHKIMEMLYIPYVGKMVDEKTLLKMKKNVSEKYESIWESACTELKEYAEFKRDLKGKNLLYKNIIKRLVDKILENDITHAPFKLIALEKEVEQKLVINIDGTEHTIGLFGILDRLQFKDNVENIIDYKTGYLDKDMIRVRVNQENMDKLFENPKLKEKFQQYFYSSIYLAGEEKQLRAGVYPLQKLWDGIIFFEDEYIPIETAALFDEKLKEMLVKIFDSTTPFPQTTEVERCTYCPYNSICYRGR